MGVTRVGGVSIEILDLRGGAAALPVGGAVLSTVPFCWWCRWQGRRSRHEISNSDLAQTFIQVDLYVHVDRLRPCTSRSNPSRLSVQRRPHSCG